MTTSRSEVPTYEFTVTVQPYLTEHEGFDPAYIQRKIRSLVAAGLDREINRVIVKRRVRMTATDKPDKPQVPGPVDWDDVHAKLTDMADKGTTTFIRADKDGYVILSGRDLDRIADAVVELLVAGLAEVVMR